MPSLIHSLLSLPLSLSPPLACVFVRPQGRLRGDGEMDQQHTHGSAMAQPGPERLNSHSLRCHHRSLHRGAASLVYVHKSTLKKPKSVQRFMYFVCIVEVVLNEDTNR